MPLDSEHLLYERFDDAHKMSKRVHELLDSTGAPWEMPVEEYDAIYDLLLEHLIRVGSIEEDGIGNRDADFSTSRYVDPISEITVVVNADFYEELVPLAVGFLNALDRPFAITFDMISYVSVVSTGNVLGYSDWEDLALYGFP